MNTPLIFISILSLHSFAMSSETATYLDMSAQDQDNDIKIQNYLKVAKAYSETKSFMNIPSPQFCDEEHTAHPGSCYEAWFDDQSGRSFFQYVQCTKDSGSVTCKMNPYKENRYGEFYNWVR